MWLLWTTPRGLHNVMTLHLKKLLQIVCNKYNTNCFSLSMNTLSNVESIHSLIQVQRNFSHANNSLLCCSLVGSFFRHDKLREYASETDETQIHEKEINLKRGRDDLLGYICFQQPLANWLIYFCQHLFYNFTSFHCFSTQDSLLHLSSFSQQSLGALGNGP